MSISNLGFTPVNQERRSASKPVHPPVSEASSMSDYNAVSSFSSSYVPGIVEVNRHAETFVDWLANLDQSIHDANPDPRAVDVTLTGPGVAYKGDIRVEAKYSEPVQGGYNIDRMVTDSSLGGQQFADHLEVRNGNVFGQEVFRDPKHPDKAFGKEYRGTVAQGGLETKGLEGTQAQVAYGKIFIELVQLPPI